MVLGDPTGSTNFPLGYSGVAGLSTVKLITMHTNEHTDELVYGVSAGDSYRLLLVLRGDC